MNHIAICKEKAIFLVQKYFIIPGKTSLNSVIRNSYPLDELQCRSLLWERAIHRRETARARAVSSGEKTSVGMKKNQG